jgi:NAD(P)-dependent dehydrogenase (short-subunit alcohol dehydrogenase family)
MRGLQDKVFIVAGGGSGIGAATAVRLAEEGARVVVGDYDGANAQAIATGIAASGGKAEAVQFDISQESSVRTLVAAAVEAYGGLDGVHVNAADMLSILSDTDAVEVALEIFDRTLQVNLRGHLLCTRLAVPELLKRGGGTLVYTTSGAAYMGEPTRVSYGVSKSGMLALMRHVASRWGKKGIRANAIAPGLVLTDAVRRGMSEQERGQVLAFTRSPRLGDPGDIASAVAFLMSDDAQWINGQVLSVDGGVTMR